MITNLLKLGRSTFSWASPETRQRLRKLGLAVIAWSPYVERKRKELCGSPNLKEEERAIMAQINCQISTSDTMFEGDIEKYFLVGLSGLRAVENVLQNFPSAAVKTVLDLPCGWGRVGRYLKARFPDAKFTACDIMTDGVDFCARRLGMTPAFSQPEFAKVNLGQKFDLIWCGSLITHLHTNDILCLLQLFERHLNDRGVVIFTAHGDSVANAVSAGEFPWIGAEAAQKTAVELYHRDGNGFIPYPGKSEQDQYGFSLTSPSWIRSQCMLIKKWKEVFFQPQGWDNFQDVYGYAKV